MACSENEFSTVVSSEGKITCKKGDTFRIDLAVIYEDNGANVDLSVYTSIDMHVKSDPQDTSTVLEFSTSNGSISVNANVITLQKSAEDMNVPAKSYVYDIQASSGATITTISEGNFIVSQDVTVSGP
jgi:hypothetical protein